MFDLHLLDIEPHTFVVSQLHSFFVLLASPNTVVQYARTVTLEALRGFFSKRSEQHINNTALQHLGAFLHTATFAQVSKPPQGT